MTKCRSFLPQINENSEILILGSMPGVKSLEMQQYYAHPQNRFWKLMGMFCHYPNMHNLEYSEKLKVLLKNKFALWDVIKSCCREGSLDSDIEKEIPNKIPDLLNKYKNIKIICLNGNKAYSALKKHFPEILNTYKCCKMPSTSLANAKFKLDDLYNIWIGSLSDYCEFFLR